MNMMSSVNSYSMVQMMGRFNSARMLALATVKNCHQVICDLTEYGLPHLISNEIYKKSYSLFWNEILPLEKPSNVPREWIYGLLSRILSICYIADYSLEFNIEFNIDRAVSLIKTELNGSQICKKYQEEIIKQMIEYYYLEKEDACRGSRIDLQNRLFKKNCDVLLLQVIFLNLCHVTVTKMEYELIRYLGFLTELLDDICDIKEDLDTRSNNTVISLLRYNSIKRNEFLEAIVVPKFFQIYCILRNNYLTLDNVIRGYAESTMRRIEPIKSLCGNVKMYEETIF